MPFLRLFHCRATPSRAAACAALIIGTIPLLGAMSEQSSRVLAEHPWNPKLASAYELSPPTTSAPAPRQLSRADQRSCPAVDARSPQVLTPDSTVTADCQDVANQQNPQVR